MANQRENRSRIPLRPRREDGFGDDWPAFPAGCRSAMTARVGGVLVTERTCLSVVLAAGEGTRMRSARPKVMHAIAGRSLLAHVLHALRGAGGTRLAVVIGP